MLFKKSLIPFFRKWIYRWKCFLIKDRWNLLFYTLLLFLPELRTNPWGFTFWSWQSLPYCFALAFVLCAIGHIIRKIIGRLWGTSFMKGWHRILHVIIYSFSFIEMYLVTAFGLRYNNTAIRLLTGTNVNEISEFFSTYLFSNPTLICIVMYSIIGFIEFYLTRKEKQCALINIPIFNILLSLYLILGLVGLSITCISFKEENPIEANRLLKRTINTGENGTVMSIFAIWSELESVKDGEILSHHIHDVKLISTNDSLPQMDIVMIIGESHIKRHTSLYGYNKQTYPLLEKIRDSLLLFNDVITPINSTHEVIRNIFSISSTDDDKKWNEVPLFPAVFKARGWNVILCSNHFTDQDAGDLWNTSINGCLNHKNVSPFCFTTRNHTTYRYDGLMIDSLFNVSDTNILNNKKPTLTLIQLFGQHFNYEDRFPPKEVFFTKDDYKDRTDLNNYQKQIVANYDNACRYNDKQLYKIFKHYKNRNAIVIYFSDHGEEVFDYRNHSGREHQLSKYAPNSYKYQIEIPFIVYMSPKFKEKNPYIAYAMQNAVDKPFMTDDICHLLFYLADIKTAWFNEKRCLIHPNYNINRKRILTNGDEYKK